MSNFPKNWPSTKSDIPKEPETKQGDAPDGNLPPGEEEAAPRKYDVKTIIFTATMTTIVGEIVRKFLRR